jgi:hypothetical protein
MLYAKARSFLPPKSLAEIISLLKRCPDNAICAYRPLFFLSEKLVNPLVETLPASTRNSFFVIWTSFLH